MYCKTCGKEINKDTNVCDNCKPVVTAAPMKPKKQGLPIWAIVLIIVIPIIMIAGVLIAIPIFMHASEEIEKNEEVVEEKITYETKLFEGVNFELPSNYVVSDSYGMLNILTDDNVEVGFQSLELSYDTLKTSMQSMTLLELSEVYADNGGEIFHVEYDLNTPLDTIAYTMKMTDGSSAVLTYSKKPDGNILIGAYVKEDGEAVSVSDIEDVEKLYTKIIK